MARALASSAICAASSRVGEITRMAVWPFWSPVRISCRRKRLRFKLEGHQMSTHSDNESEDVGVSRRVDCPRCAGAWAAKVYERLALAVLAAAEHGVFEFDMELWGIIGTACCRQAVATGGECVVCEPVPVRGRG